MLWYVCCAFKTLVQAAGILQPASRNMVLMLSNRVGLDFWNRDRRG